MKIALLQFAPDVGTVQANIKKADDLLQQSKLPVDLDWLILPEMAFSGEQPPVILHFASPEPPKAVHMQRRLHKPAYAMHSNLPVVRNHTTVQVLIVSRLQLPLSRGNHALPGAHHSRHIDTMGSSSRKTLQLPRNGWLP